ncbi:MAG: hypothetical protein WC503_00430 [Candidatus Shapirobacteria bacterium]
MKRPHFSIKEVKKIIGKEQPKLVFIAGKTCVGKSTFARDLKIWEYEHLELDLVVRESVIKRFGVLNPNEAFLVYKGIAPENWQKSFEKATHKLIEERLKFSKVVVDAALADVGVLKRVFSKKLDNFFCVYIHPFSRDFYYKNIFNRFVNDAKNNTRSFPIWDYVTPEVFDDYQINGNQGLMINQVVYQYADESTKLSKERFELFEKAYPKIILTGN